MLCTTTNNTFERIIKFIKPISQEVTINFDYDNINAETIDSGMVMFVKMKYKTDIECDEQQEIIIQHEKIEKFIKGKKEVPITIEIGNGLRVKIGKKKLTMPKIVNTERKRALPNIPFDAVISIGAKEFSEAVKDVGLVGNVATFEFKDGDLILSSHNDEGQDYEFVFGIINVKSSVNCKATFAYDYLSDIAGAIKDCETLIISMGDNKPISIGVDDDDVELTYFLANRIVND